jgi:signal transduction histidine kinase
MLGKTDFDFLPLEEAQRCRDDEIFIMESGESIEDQEESLTRCDGSRSWVSVSKFPWKDVDGEIIGVIGISRNISERKAMQEHILRMLSIATHDMRSPILGASALIKVVLRGELEESTREKLGKADERLMTLDRIVRDYLCESSILGTALLNEKEEFDLRQDIIDPLLSDLFLEIKEKNICIDSKMGEIPRDRILVKANKGWLGIVYRNLFSNAIKHIEQDGIIAFGFEDWGNFYRLNVYNDGPPVDPLNREKIFNILTSMSGSTGLGLPISREIMRKHKGDLWYEETLDGHPNFVFTLPKE